MTVQVCLTEGTWASWGCGVQEAGGTFRSHPLWIRRGGLHPADGLFFVSSDVVKRIVLATKLSHFSTLVIF